MESKFLRNLQIGFGFSLLLLIISSAASFISIKNLINSAEMVKHTNDVIGELNGVIAEMVDAETGQRGYLLSNDVTFLAPYIGSYQKTLDRINRLKRLTSDNNLQQKSLRELEVSVKKRFLLLQDLIDRKKQQKVISNTELYKGKAFMDDSRLRIAAMVQEEQNLLKIRTDKLVSFTNFSPVIIIFTAVLSLFITLVFYQRTRSDFRTRENLRRELKTKDDDINNRINIIQNVAKQIIAGDYAIRIEEAQMDNLGVLADYIDKMTISLQQSFKDLSEKEWLQSGIASLNEKMVGEKDLQTLTSDILSEITTSTNSHVAAFYLVEHNQLKLISSQGFTKAHERAVINLGEGMVGQSAKNNQTISLRDINPDDITIDFASASVKAKNIIAFPVHYEKEVTGVIELVSVNEFSEIQYTYLNSSAHNIGIALNSSRSRQKVQELLEETQSQSEELLTQHTELENLNTELEANSQKLQASEEELRVQQEELMQTNQELEERSKLLEEKNHLILIRNLEIQKKADELAQTTKYKSEFLANMSHELRTPLNSILLLSRLMAENNEGNLLEDQIESAKVIQSSGNGLLTLIDEILDLSKIEAGKMELEYHQVAIKSIANDMQQLFLPLAKDKKIDFLVELSADLPAVLETDKLRLEQVLKNLISNALKFTNQGHVKLHISKSKQADHLDFAVSDTGIGISEDKQDLIFEAFQQADGSTKRKFGGTGLGLSISKELSYLLGGALTVKSKENEGSTFTCTIPVFKKDNLSVEKVENTTNQLPAKEVSRNHNVAEAPKKQFLSNLIPNDVADDRNDLLPGDKCILIVEDDIPFANTLIKFAKDNHYKTIVAVRGDQAFTLAKKYQPNAILLDIQLPIKDGWAVMEELKAHRATRHIPVHIMSSLQVKNESIEYGAVDFISKPFAFDDMQIVFEKLENALNRQTDKVLIVEENINHATALSYFLTSYNIISAIVNNIKEAKEALKKPELKCVVLATDLHNNNDYEELTRLRQNNGMEELPIIVFTGRILSKADESDIKKFADSIVVKTAHSYQRILDEVALFLHLVEEYNKKPDEKVVKKLGNIQQVLKDKTVLVADDDVRNIFSLTKSLEQHQMNVVFAVDGKEAINQLSQNKNIDIVLMDMMMPELDGYEAIAQIRNQSKYKNLPIIAVTAKAMRGDREKCLQAGASDYISKPVDIDQLISLMRVWLYNKQG